MSNGAKLTVVIVLVVVGVTGFSLIPPAEKRLINKMTWKLAEKGMQLRPAQNVAILHKENLAAEGGKAELRVFGFTWITKKPEKAGDWARVEGGVTHRTLKGRAQTSGDSVYRVETVDFDATLGLRDVREITVFDVYRGDEICANVQIRMYRNASDCSSGTRSILSAEEWAVYAGNVASHIPQYGSLVHLAKAKNGKYTMVLLCKDDSVAQEIIGAFRG